MRAPRMARIGLAIIAIGLVAIVFVSIGLISHVTSTGKVIIVGPNQVPCEQGSSSACYLVKSSSSDPWRVVNSTFEKLSPVDGTQYTLRVRELNKQVNASDPYAVPKVTFRVVDVVNTEQVLGRIKWYYG